MQRKKQLLVGSVTVVSISFLIIGFLCLNPFFRGPNVSLRDKVELFVVHYESGVNMTVYPSTSEGAELLSACEGVMNNLYGQLLWAVLDEDVARIKNSSQYVDVMLKDTYNFTFFVHLSAKIKGATANRILFFLSGDHKGVILFAIDMKEDIIWGGSYTVETSSKEFQKLVNVISELS